MCSQHLILCESGSLRRLIADRLCSVHQHCSVFPRRGSVLQNRLRAPAPRRWAASSAMDDTIKRRKLDDEMVPPLLEFAAARPRVTDPPLQHTTGSSFKVPGLQVTDHYFKVPLDYSGMVEGQITVFAREIKSPTQAHRNLPYLLFLQGGPGFESPRPTENSSWFKSATNNFRVVLLDQRGTGRSTPVTTSNLARQGTPEQQAKYLTLFRADSIVQDAELVRQCLVPRSSNDGRWSLLGQSFGGFCCLTYLSLAPQGLIEVMMTGGIAPGITDLCAAERAYRKLYRRVLTQNTKYYSRYPGDVAVVQRIVSYLAAQPGGGVVLPSGTVLTPRALQLCGLSGLGTGGGFDRLHYLLESFFDGDNLVNPAFLKAFEAWMPWDANPLYALLHESIYCQGGASYWAAHRVRQEEFQAEFDAVECARRGSRVNFTGEMVFPWMFEDFAALTPFKETADLLARRVDWGPLYRPEVLKATQVPVAAATYLEDMYVDYDLAQETVAFVKGMRQWVTNEYKHSGIRDDGARIVDRLMSMARDVVLAE